MHYVDPHCRALIASLPKASQWLAGKLDRFSCTGGGGGRTPQLSDDGPSTAVHSELVSVPNGRCLSQILTTIACDETRHRISVGDLVDTFGNRAWGALIFIFAAPNVLPVVVPGLSAILGAPLLFLTWQLATGRPYPWLPAIIRTRSFRRGDFQRLVERVAPWLQRVERMVRPRVFMLTEPLAERLIGGVALALAVILFLPIPFGNMLPALALALFALGILERDGVAVLAGLLSAIVSATLVAGVLYGLAMAALFITQNALGL